jgi:hypothetical protein
VGMLKIAVIGTMARPKSMAARVSFSFHPNQIAVTIPTWTGWVLADLGVAVAHRAASRSVPVEHY